MAESIKVAARVRPLTYRELDQNASCILSVQGPAVTVLTSPPKSFTFDCTFWSTDPDDPNPGTQEMVMADIGNPVIDNVLKGFNTCVFAYGGTGTGKSFTVMGFPQSPGLVPRIVEALFMQKSKLSAKNDELRIWVSFMELYNERIRDLLSAERSPQEPEIVDNPELGVSMPGLTESLCDKTADVHKLMDFGTKRRVIASTNMNATSSRSHSIFTIRLQRLTGVRPAEGKRDDRKVISSKLHLIDLAGSERLGCTGPDGLLQQEGCAINQSLMALGHVVREVCKPQERGKRNSKTTKLKDQVPFGISKLTLILRESLIGNFKTYCFATVSPASTSLDETLSTLRFAASLRKIRTVARANTGRRDDLANGLQTDIKRLRRELEGYPDEQLALTSERRRMALMQEITERERLLNDFKRPLNQDLDVEAARDALFKELGVTEEDFSEAKGIDMNVPYLLNMNEDPALAGCIMYFLPSRVITTIGAHPENKIVLQGLGIPDHLCNIENSDHQDIVISMPSPDLNALSKGRVCINGRALRMRPDERQQLKHNDKLYFGRAVAMRLIVPETARALGKADAMALTEDLNDANLTRSLAVEDSRAWGELQLYLEDLWQRLGEERGRELFDHLSEASHLVDEANEITAELRPHDRMKFEVELVWDIHRDARDIIVIRLLQYKPASNTSLTEYEPMMGDEVDGMTVLAYWTLPKFKVRLDQMRDCYDLQHHSGGWGHSSESLDDPWAEPSIVELRRSMYTYIDIEMQNRFEGTPAAQKASVPQLPPPPVLAVAQAPASASTSPRAGRPLSKTDERVKRTEKAPARSRSRSRTRSPSATPGGSTPSLGGRRAPSASSSPAPQRRQVPKSLPNLPSTAGDGPAGNAIQEVALASATTDLSSNLEGMPSPQSTIDDGGSISITSRLSMRPPAGLVSQDELISTLQEQLQDKDDKIELYELRIASLQQQINMYDKNVRHTLQDTPAVIAVMREAANTEPLSERITSRRESSMRSGSSAIREASTSVGREASVRSDTSTARRSAGIPAVWSPVAPLSPGSPTPLSPAAPMSPTPVYIPDSSASRGRSSSAPRWTTPPLPVREAVAPRLLNGQPAMLPGAQVAASPAKVASRVIRTASPLRTASTPLGGTVSLPSPGNTPWPEGSLWQALPRQSAGTPLQGKSSRRTGGSARSIEELFDRVDLNKDGIITRDEFRQAFRREDFRQALSGADGSATVPSVPPIPLPAALPVSAADSPHFGHGRAHRIVFAEPPPPMVARTSMPPIIKHHTAADRVQEPALQPSSGHSSLTSSLKPPSVMTPIPGSAIIAQPTSGPPVLASAPASPPTRMVFAGTAPAQMAATSVSACELVQHGSVQLPVMPEAQVRSLHPAMAREHALLLQRTIGHERIGVVPVADQELYSWILSVQRSQLENLRKV